MADQPSHVYEFGPFCLDTGQGVLLHHGERVPLVPKAIEVLRVLVEDAGRVVTKDRLMDAVWPDAIVQEGNLSKLVFLLRRQLEAASGWDGGIQTVAKRGYVFTGQVRAAAAPPPLVRFGDALAQAVAVLPFVDASPDRERPHVGEGLAEEILHALSRVRDLFVVARTSSFRFGGRDVDIKAIGRELGVSAVLEGSVRRDGDCLRVTARLIDARTGFQRWSDSFDRAATTLFTTADEIASAVARCLLKTAPAPARAARYVPDPEAYELYLQGRYLWNRRPGEVVWRALECFEQAAKKDPRFAAAWAGIADVYSTLGSWEAAVLPHDEAQATARRYAQRALEIDPHLAEAQTTLAYATLHHGWDLSAAEAGFRRALGENPDYAAAHHWYSHCLAAAGRVDESLAESRLALALDPMNLLMHVHLAWHYHMARQPARVLEESERVVRMDPHYHWAYYFLAWGAEGVGETTRAVDACRQALRCLADNRVMQAALGRALAMAGDRRAALGIADALGQGAEARGLYAYEIALIHAGLGDPQTAIDFLTTARRDRSGWIVYARVDPRLDALRDDPRFRALLP